MMEGGSISALGVPVQSWYKVGKTSDEVIKKGKGDLVLLDIQYLGNQDVSTFMDSISKPRHNALFIAKDSHIYKVICDDKVSSTSADGVTKYMKRYQRDELKGFYTDYDSIIDSLVRKEIFAGSVTKIRRLPVLSVYKNASAMEFIQALADNSGESISDANSSDFIIHSGKISSSSPKVYLIGSEDKLSYQHSFIIEPETMKLKKVSGKSTLTSYKSHQSSDMIINGCNMVKLIDEALS